MNVSLSPIGLPVAQLVRVVPLDRASSLELPHIFKVSLMKFEVSPVAQHLRVVRLDRAPPLKTILSVSNEMQGFTSWSTRTTVTPVKTGTIGTTMTTRTAVTTVTNDNRDH